MDANVSREFHQTTPLVKAPMQSISTNLNLRGAYMHLETIPQKMSKGLWISG